MSAEKPMSGSAEDRLIARYFAPLATHAGALGLRDDAALLTPPPGCDLVLTKDALVAGVHFFADDAPDAVARKALRVNLSDLAAKGAKPEGFLLALALPTDVAEASLENKIWLESFARGLGDDAEAYACPLLGGDTVKTPGPLMVSITAFGSVPSGTMVKRSGARAGDRVFVTGSIGDAALGLTLRNDAGAAARWKLDRAQADHLLGRYLLPQPRNALAKALRMHASAAMDVSDGLAGDFAKLCQTSGVTAQIDVARVPLSEAAKAALAAEPALIDTILGGGDDYEIVCTMGAAEGEKFRAAAAAIGVDATEIGRVVAGEGAPRFLDAGGRVLSLSQASFSHF
jgi:thiamine-monophosphate kinase